MFANASWQPTKIERVISVVQTSTRPLHVVTDKGLALVKYMGNRLGEDALICELLGTALARCIGLYTPDFAVVAIKSIEVLDPFITICDGPAFFSKWEHAVPLSPNSSLLANVRHKDHIAKLVTFDTWVRNKDRFSMDYGGRYENNNFDNVLFKPDKRKTSLLVIDHSHAFTETTLADELDEGWVSEKIVYGLFDEFKPILKANDVQLALEAIRRIDVAKLRAICDAVPREWGMTAALSERLASLITLRAEALCEWLSGALFNQLELNLIGKGQDEQVQF